MPTPIGADAPIESGGGHGGSGAGVSGEDVDEGEVGLAGSATSAAVGVADVAPAAGATPGATQDGGTDSGPPIRVNIDASSITLFELPIGSTRYAAAGFDPDTHLCASIIWDYSNNDLEVARHCGDFLAYDNFPYVLVAADPSQPCSSLWQYGGLTPASASGCIDPVEGSVNAQVEVAVDGHRYVIQMSNE